MNSQEYLDTMKDIQENIVHFLEEKANSEESFQNLESKFNDTRKSDNNYYLLSILHLVSEIGNNFHRFPNFFAKIEKILLFFKDDIKKYFTNSGIFNIFKCNKRILLFLIEQQMMVIDEYVAKKITTTDKCIEAKYPQYFQPELQPFANEKWFQECENTNDEEEDENEEEENKNDEEKNKNDGKEIKKELPENFYEKRKEGENDSQICELIRNDKIKEFDKYVTKNGVSLNSTIESSIYETNSFILEKQGDLSLIEYAAFFGSIKIFNHLHKKDVELTPSLWLLAIHGKNSEIIHILEENKVKIEDKSYKQAFYESIKCHHNDIANDFIKKSLPKNEVNSQDTINQCLKYYNIAFLKHDSINESSFFNLCKYDYCALVDILFKGKDINVNKKDIFNILLIQFQIIFI